MTTPEDGQAFVNQLCDAIESAIKDACKVVNPAASNSAVTGGAIRRTQFWNVIKRSKQKGKCSDVRIGLKPLINYFEQTFSPPTV